MSYDDLYRKILKLLPEAETGEDNGGQLVIYTNKKLDDDRQTVVNFTEDQDRR